MKIDEGMKAFHRRVVGSARSNPGQGYVAVGSDDLEETAHSLVSEMFRQGVTNFSVSVGMTYEDERVVSVKVLDSD